MYLNELNEAKIIEVRQKNLYQCFGCGFEQKSSFGVPKEVIPCRHCGGLLEENMAIDDN